MKKKIFDFSKFFFLSTTCSNFQKVQRLIKQIDPTTVCVCFGITYTKIGTIQRRLAWPLRKDDTQIREAFQIFLHVPHVSVGIRKSLN